MLWYGSFPRLFVTRTMSTEVTEPDKGGTAAETIDLTKATYNDLARHMVEDMGLDDAGGVYVVRCEYDAAGLGGFSESNLTQYAPLRRAADNGSMIYVGGSTEIPRRVRGHITNPNGVMKHFTPVELLSIHPFTGARSELYELERRVAHELWQEHRESPTVVYQQ